MTEELEGSELSTSGSASPFKVKHCEVQFPQRPVQRQRTSRHSSN